MWSLRIVDLFRLDKSLDMIKSNHQLNTAKSTSKPCLSAVFTSLLKTSRDGKSTASLGSSFLCQNALFMNKFLLISNLNLCGTTQGHCFIPYQLLPERRV